MAEVIISPGVFQQETDQSFYTANPQVIGAAVVGPTVKGSPFVPTYVTSYNQFTTLYGDIFKPSQSSYYYEYFTSQTVKEYFANGGSTVLVTRIISGSDNVSTYATSSVIGRGPLASASLFTAANPTNGAFFSITGSSDGIISASVLQSPQSVTLYLSSSATIPAGGTRVATGTTGLDNLNNIIAAINSRQATLGIRAELTGTTSPYGLFLTSIYPGTVGNLFFASGSAFVGGQTGSQNITFEALSWGDLMNNSGSEDSNGGLANGTNQNVRWEVPYTDPITGLFTVIVRRGSDNTQQKDVLETWSNLSLDPQLPNYVSRVIGDMKSVPDVVNGTVTSIGNYRGSSQFIRVATIPGVLGDSIDNSGNFQTRTLAKYLPLERSSGSFSGGKAATNISTSALLFNENIGIGTDTGSNIQGFLQSDYVNGLNMLTDKDAFQFNVLLAPGVGLDASTAATKMINVVENRGDAIAIIDSGIYGTSIAQAVVNASSQQSSYAATYYPWVQLYSQGLGKSVLCPPSTVIGGVLSYNDTATAEWFAPAGLNRGGIPSVIKTERRVQQTDRDVLYNGRINPIATFPGVGVCVWGQKTLQKKPSALDRVNVRRLLISLKQFIGGVARTLVFEQNTTATRNRFVAQVNPYLSSVVQRQGLYAYKVVMDATNNTADVVDRNQLVGQIYIQPTKTAEFVILNFNILPTGATFPA
jgi:hypothetical protein